VFESPRGHHYFKKLDAGSDLLGRVVLRGCCVRLHSQGFDVSSQCFDVMAVGTRNEVAVEVQPIRNPVTGEEHRARIVLPDGFEYKEAEMGNTMRFWVKTSHLSFAHENCYAQLNAFDWSNR
jgi:hypothetical protein